MGERANGGTRGESPLLGILRMRIHAGIMQAIKGGRAGPIPLIRLTDSRCKREFHPSSFVTASTRQVTPSLPAHVFLQWQFLLWR